tara:strand:+ start:203 stop:2335 length:2133 start_codon:yes stop_codon:yes gene_type:complete
MKISILLPFKENFSPNYAGAVSLFVKDTSKISKFKKNITIFGNTEYKKKFNLKYKNIPIKKKIFQGQNKAYVNEFIKFEIKNNSNLIELHNRPFYLKLLKNQLNNKIYTFYFHNDPLTMTGSKSIKDRTYLINNCHKVIFNSNWSKKRFLQGMHFDYVNSEKLLVINQSAKKNKFKSKDKKNIITFVGKLNKAKGYDIFGHTVVKILKKYKNWKSIVIGDEPRDQLEFKHDRLLNLGFVNHEKVLNIYKKTSIAIVCSRWDEPFGRTSLEASANGCAVIISNKGGLPETVTNAIILKKLNSLNLFKEVEYLIKNPKIRSELQRKSHENFYLTHSHVTKLLDKLRSEILITKNIYLKKPYKPIRIIHVTNFNERHNGRLFFNTGRRLNNGFIRSGHTVLEFSDRDIQKHYKSYKDLSGGKSLNEKLYKTCHNFKPDMIVLGHADLIETNTLGNLKDEYPHLKISQWFLDPLNKYGPDYIKNKYRILDKSKFVDANFITTSPDALNFLSNKTKNFFIPNPTDPSFETLENYKNECSVDVFFALSHGVHRGKLKLRNSDDRELFINKLLEYSKSIKFDLYGVNQIQPIWADQFFKVISNAKMGLNLSRGEPIKYYSSDRIAQIIGNGLVTLIDEKTCYNDFFDKSEMVFYKNLSDLSEKIMKISKDEKLRKLIGKRGRDKYHKYFNSNLVSEFIVNKTLDINDNKNKYLWHRP